MSDDYYTLRRATSKHPDWAHFAGAFSDALKDFEKKTGFPLRQIENEHEHGEFVLEQRERLPSRHGPGFEPGAVLQAWRIARATK
jgi:hypothetical protein